MLSTLGLSLVIIVALGAVVNLVLGDRLRSDLSQRLVERAHYGSVLAGRGLTGQSLADELTGQGIAVSVTSPGHTYIGRELAVVTTTTQNVVRPTTTITTTITMTPNAAASTSPAPAVLRRMVVQGEPVAQVAALDESSASDASSASRTAGVTKRHRPHPAGRSHSRSARATTTRAAATSAMSAAADAARLSTGPAAPVIVAAAAPTDAGAHSPVARPTPSVPPEASHPKPASTRAASSTPSTPVALTESGSALTAKIYLGSTIVVLTASEADIDRTLSTLRTIEIVVGALVLILAGALSISLVSQALSPLRRMARLAEQIRSGDRGRRLRPRRADTDLGQMATSIDQMLEALESAELEAQGSEHRMRQFLADASHDLRTPLAVMLAEAEQLLRANPERAEREARLVGLIREGRRAGRLVDDLVLMARLDDPDPSAALLDQPLDLHELVESATAHLRMTLPERFLTFHGPSEPMPIHGDPDRLTRAVSNLIENAAHATRPRGHIAVTLELQDGLAMIDVIDDGPGIPPDQVERVFDRFVRLDQARSGSSSGLGLPIARAVARGHGGDLTYLTGNVGAHFRLTIPVARVLDSHQPRHARPGQPDFEISPV